MQFGIETQSEYIINKADISSNRSKEITDIKNVITDMLFFEHIEKPYITAKIAFLDQENLVQDIDFQGGEKLSLELTHAEERLSGFSIKKDFVVDSIEAIVKADERSETVTLNCTEYHMLESTVQNAVSYTHLRAHET